MAGRTVAYASHRAIHNIANPGRPLPPRRPLAVRDSVASDSEALAGFDLFLCSYRSIQAPPYILL